MENKANKRLKTLRLGEYEKFFVNSKYKEDIVIEELGRINLPTGEIVANDPLCFYQTKAFEKKAKIGTYPVVLYVHHISDDRRVAFAEIRFSENMPENFELATLEGQDAKDLGEDEFFGYGVDSGTGGFMDKLTCDQLGVILKDTDDGVLPELDKMIEESYIDTYSVANYTLPNTENNLVAFSSGYGDGSYPSYWGYGKAGELCCLITDFYTIDYNYDKIEETVINDEEKEFKKTGEDRLKKESVISKLIKKYNLKFPK